MSEIVNLEKYFKNYSEGKKKGIIERNKLHNPNDKNLGCFFLKNIDGKDYFLKIGKDNQLSYQMVAELVAEELAALVNLRITNSNIAIINLSETKKPRYKYCLISDDYRKDNYDVFSGRDIIHEYLSYLEESNLLYEVLNVSSIDELRENEDKLASLNNLSFVWDSYLYHYRNYPNCNDIVESKMMEQVQRYIFRFLVMDNDYHLSNSEELDNIYEHTSQMAPMYDLDEAFSNKFSKCNNSLKSETYDVADPYEDFEHFLSISDKSFVELASNMHKVLTFDALREAFYDVEVGKHIVIPEEYKSEIFKVYKDHYYKVAEILKEYVDVRKTRKEKTSYDYYDEEMMNMINETEIKNSKRR